ncbi:uncharacterized protein LOC124620098 [Schistocerca americana]|uniref:uncharacterized protein LOC124620098 n=1 Tax=Schistocerca americana TaxID=7009 RepID=UPI001F4F8DE5|nr:uncharacterized protein LOC124620098 [Schistocerca americana]
MGSSTTSTSSNNTINTSTDSANTVATLITVTDGDCDDEADPEPETKAFSPPPERPAVSAQRRQELLDEIFSSVSAHAPPESPLVPPPAPPVTPLTPLLGACRRDTRLFARSEDLDSPPAEARGPAPAATLPPPAARAPHGHPLPALTLRRASSVSTPPTVVPLNPDKVPPRGGTGTGEDVSEAAPPPRLHRRSTRGSRHKRKSTSSSGGGGGGRAAAAAAVGSPAPDLRVDYFSEDGAAPVLPPPHLDASQTPTADVDVSVSAAAGGGAAAAAAIVAGRHPNQQPTAIVVQPGANPGVATVLLKDARAQREENMKQLLDVANNLTLQELHDFEMRYGSPHHSRSQSVKAAGSSRPTYLSLPQQRSRVASMPNTGVEEEYYRLRHFSITGKGVVNRGDSLKSRRSRSNNSVTSSNSSHSTEHLTAQHCGSARTSATASLASSRESSAASPPAPLRVVMLGAAGVGKSSLVSQFMTSEYLHAYDTSLDDEYGEKSVSVLLDGEESELTFIDHPCSEMSPENCVTTYDPHAFCVVYSTADRGSLRVAEEVLQCLWKSDSISTKAVILVANKTDLVRSRTVTTDEGKSMATSYDCKFIETSVAINHNVDELLVGLLTQIRLKRENPERARDLLRKRSSRRSPAGGSTGGGGAVSCGTNKPYRGARTSTSLKVKGLLGRVWARDSKSKSCENLHVL